MDGYARILIRVFSVLGRDGIFLQGHGLSGINGAVLQNNSGVSEYEIYGPVNLALAVELAIGVHVQGVLVPENLAPVYHRVVRPDPKSHRLVSTWAGPVHKRHVPSNEASPGGSCQSTRAN